MLSRVALCIFFAVPCLYAGQPEETAHLRSSATLAVPAQQSGSKVVWRELLSPHFQVYHESNWMPAGLVVELEKIHGKLRMDMSMFAPWMTSSKTKIYIYASRASFLKGEFNPPPWSRGLAVYEKRCIVIYDEGSRDRLRSIIAHELTHLFFESFFSEHGRLPPLWLNEGLAVSMEDRSADGEGPWSSALKSVTPARMSPLRSHFAQVPGDSDASQKVSDWYMESFGVVKFLFQPSKRLQFKNFCESLRNGVPLEQALWNIYRYHTVQDLDAAWRQWLFSASGSAQKQSSVPQFSQQSFKPFSTHEPESSTR